MIQQLGNNADDLPLAGKALKDNITSLGPQVLPLAEKLVFVGNMIARKVLKLKWAPYIPDFQEATKHICIHTGRQCNDHCHSHQGVQLQRFTVHLATCSMCGRSSA